MHRKVMAFLVVALLVLTSCRSQEKKAEGALGKQISLTQLASNLKTKHGKEELFTGEKFVVARDEGIPLSLDFDFTALGYTKFNQVAAVFADKELNYSVKATYDRSHEEKNQPLKTLTVLPPRSGAGVISSLESQRGDLGYQIGETTLFNTKDQEDWGNLSEYYLAVFVDLKTGKKLSEPEITPFSVKHELSTDLRLQVTMNDLGMPVFKWNKVKGAKEYYLVKSGFSETADTKTYSENVIVARTKGNKWQPRHNQASLFSTHSAHFDKVEKISKNTNYVYAVIALSEKGTSAMSNTITDETLAKRVPQSQRQYLDDDGEKLSSEEIWASRVSEDGLLALLPTYRWVTYGDGKQAQRLITYHIEEAYQDEQLLMGTDVDGKQIGGVEEAIVIPYSIDGTYFDDHYIISIDKGQEWQVELQAVKKRQDKLRSKAGATELMISASDQSTQLKDLDAQSSQISEVTDQLTANSALTEYLASNMLASKTLIDLDDFADAQSADHLYDAWMEAVYQNPLVLGVNGAQLTAKGQVLEVMYEQPPTERLAQQEEVRAAVKKIVATLIEDEMSELEKELAINKYLMENAKYDDKALANAEKNNFAKVDPKYQDAFTPYGVLINKTGVCASYAGAFKLLADAAGLETIVVTGYLNGEIPHAWNKVKIADEWLIVDSTNNADDTITNPLFNVPKTVSGTVLIEDDRYVLDEYLAKYQGTDKQEQNEYYHAEAKFFDSKAIVAALTKEIKRNDSATYRTKYDLTEDEFQRIKQQVADQFKDQKVVGFYWLGVLNLVIEED